MLIQIKNSENVPKLEPVEVVLVHFTLSKVLFSFVPNKQFGQLINISPNSLTMMNAVNTEFSFLKFGLQIKLVKHLKLKIM